MKETMLYPEVYSDGTLRSIDLIEAVLIAIDPLRLSREERKTVSEGKRAYKWLSSHSRMDFCEEKFNSRYGYYPDDIYSDLCDIADAHCSPYCYWGSSEGDGACIGVFVVAESIEEDLRYNENLLYIEYASDSYIGLAVDISDHGNMTLYQCNKGKSKEIWAIA